MLFGAGCRQYKTTEIKTNFSDEELTYFSEIALGSEFEPKSIHRLKRWEKNINIHLTGNYTKKDSIEVLKVINELNHIIDDISIKISGSKQKSNLIIYFIPKLKFQQFNKNAERCSGGYFHYKWNIWVGIYEGYILINEKLISDYRYSVIREEITQSLGLPNDSWRYPQSIFYQGYSRRTEYAPIDIKMIQLLYNNHLPVGMTKKAYERNILFGKVLNHGNK